jgi:asparagine synthase (glutamine-hydrolysing)
MHVACGSERRALVSFPGIDRAPDPAGWVGFCLWGSVPEPWTIHRGVRLLPAGHLLRIGPSGVAEPRAYTSLAGLIMEGSFLSPEEFRDRVREELLKSVGAHLVADVPVGVFLSAGIDSAALVGLARETTGAHLRTITLGFEEFRGCADDEVPLAELTARRYGTEHTTVMLSKDTLRDLWPQTLRAMDQPSIDGMNTWLVCRAAHQAGLKCALSGVGGDELFGGYPSFTDVPRWVRSLAAIHHVPGARDLAELCARLWTRLDARAPVKLPGLLRYGETFAGAYFVRRAIFLPEELPALIDSDFARDGLERLAVLDRLEKLLAPCPAAPLGKMMVLESSVYLRNQLLRDADWASMDHGLELRTPWADAFLLRALGASLASRGTPSKEPLALAPRRPLPDAVLQRPKTGFTIPWDRFLPPRMLAREAAPPRPGRISRGLVRLHLEQTSDVPGGRPPPKKR